MDDIKIHTYEEMDVANAMVVIGFPTVGLISTIVANFLVSEMKLKRIAAFTSKDFYPAAIIQEGVPTPPVRVFAGKNVCGPKDACDQIVVITSELPVNPRVLPALADRIIDWCQERNCKTVISIEGVNSQTPPENESKVFHVGSNAEALSQLEGLPSESLDSGMVSGLSGLLLYKGNMRDFSVACLLAEAHAEYPDSRSAASVLSILDKMVPQIKMDPEPLLKQAEEIEEQIKKGMSQIKPANPAELAEIPAGMYR